MDEKKLNSIIRKERIKRDLKNGLAGLGVFGLFYTVIFSFVGIFFFADRGILVGLGISLVTFISSAYILCTL